MDIYSQCSTYVEIGLLICDINNCEKTVKSQTWKLASDTGQCPVKNWIMSEENCFSTNAVVRRDVKTQKHSVCLGLLCSDFSFYEIFNQLIPGGSKVVTHTFSCWFVKACVTLLLPSGIKGLIDNLLTLFFMLKNVRFIVSPWNLQKDFTPIRCSFFALLSTTSLLKACYMSLHSPKNFKNI